MLCIGNHLQAPRKPRGKYGKRQDISPEEKLLISRERNREHARATRLRRKVFEVVLEDQLSKLQNSLEVTLRRTRVASDANLMQYVADVFKALVGSLVYIHKVVILG